ncbi:MAG: hypothetical protein HY286_17840 [Planctomycetes bacterium]|nr:hypothetical protein [Planctomycetota bacterium]
MRKKASGVARLATAVIMLYLTTTPACVTAGRRTGGALLTESHRAWIAKRVSQFRGLPVPASRTVEMQSRAQVEEEFMKEAGNSLSETSIEARLRADVALGYLKKEEVPQGPASRPFTRADLGVAGTYDPETKKIIIVNDLAGGGHSELALAHELTHFADDARHGLAKLCLSGRGNSDRALALQSLIEGSAMIIQLDFALAENYEDCTGTLGSLSVTRTLEEFSSDYGLIDRIHDRRAREMFESTPLYLRERLAFPYGNGLAFARSLRMKQGNAAIDAAFEHSPRSTEQILHPEKFYDWRDDPSEIALDTTFADGNAETVAEDTLGELGIRQLLEKLIDSASARAGAEGWGGDRYRIISAGGADVLCWLTDWDTESDAREFANIYDTWAAKRYETHAWWMSEPGSDDLARPDGRFLQIRRFGTAVAIVDGAPAGSNWAAKLFEKSKITKAPVSNRSKSFLAALASPVVAVDQFDSGGGFGVFGGILASGSHRGDASTFSLLGGTLLDVQNSADGGRVSILFGLISWRTAPREDLFKLRIGVSAYAKDEETSSWSLLPIVNAPAASSAPGSSTFRTGLLNLQSGYDVEFDGDGKPSSDTKTSGETSLLLGLTGHGWVERTDAAGTPYKRSTWWGPFEIGFLTISDQLGPIAPIPGADSRPADPRRMMPGDVQVSTRTQMIGELLFKYESGAYIRDGKPIDDPTNWTVLNGLLASGGRRGDDWKFRTPIVGFGNVKGRDYLIFLWGLIAIPVSGAPAPESRSSAAGGGDK